MFIISYTFRSDSSFHSIAFSSHDDKNAPIKSPPTKSIKAQKRGLSYPLLIQKYAHSNVAVTKINVLANKSFSRIIIIQIHCSSKHNYTITIIRRVQCATHMYLVIINRLCNSLSPHVELLKPAAIQPTCSKSTFCELFFCSSFPLKFSTRQQNC